MAVRYRFWIFLLPSSSHSPSQINENCSFLPWFCIFHRQHLVPKSCPHLCFVFSFSVCKRIGKSCLRSLSRPRKLVPRDLSRSRCWNLSLLARPETVLLLFHALGARFRGCPTTLHLWRESCFSRVTCFWRPSQSKLHVAWCHVMLPRLLARTKLAVGRAPRCSYGGSVIMRPKN